MSILLDPAARLVVGHRGAAAHAPENTMPSFRRALELGADALELDVHLTADGEVVVLHDPRVDRTTDGVGDVATLSSAQLRALDAGARWTRDGGTTYPWRGRGVQVPRLDELLEEFADAPLMIDAKTLRVAAPLARVLARHRAQPRVLVGSFHRAHLAPFAGSEWFRLASREQAVWLLLRGLVAMSATTADYAALAIPPALGALRLPASVLARGAHAARRPLHVWSVDAPDLARTLWEAGANGLIGDDPAMLLAVRSSLATAR